MEELHSLRNKNMGNQQHRHHLGLASRWHWQAIIQARPWLGAFWPNDNSIRHMMMVSEDPLRPLPLEAWMTSRIGLTESKNQFRPWPRAFEPYLAGVPLTMSSFSSCSSKVGQEMGYYHSGYFAFRLVACFASHQQ